MQSTTCLVLKCFWVVRAAIFCSRFACIPVIRNPPTLVARKVMPPIYLHGDYKETIYKEHKQHYVIEQILSYKTLVFNIVTTICYAFFASNKQGPARCSHENLYGCPKHASYYMFQQWCQWHITHNLTVLTSTVGLQMDQFFPHGKIHWHTFASYALLCHVPFCLSCSLVSQSNKA